MEKLNLVATGGTFDCMHIGHIKLLSTAFDISHHVIIGLTSDKFVKRYKLTSNIKNNYLRRLFNLKRNISLHFKDANYTIIKLEDEFGPVIHSSQIQGIVVSEETLMKVKQINEIRISKYLEPLQVIVIEIAKSSDGKPISSTRIRNGEIDNKGKILWNEKYHSSFLLEMDWTLMYFDNTVDLASAKGEINKWKLCSDFNFEILLYWYWEICFDFIKKKE